MRRLATALVLGLLVLPSAAWPADPVSGKSLDEIKKERLRLQAITKKLEAQLGDLGTDLRELDLQLVAASQAARQADEAVADASDKLAELTEEQTMLERQIETLRVRMHAQVAAAYRHSGVDSMLVVIAQGASVTEMPHRRQLLTYILQTQERDKQAYRESLAQLEEVLVASRQQLAALKTLQREQAHKRSELQQRVDAKRELWRKVKRDATLRKQRDTELARQEKALMDLLDGLGSRLTGTDITASSKTLRQRKGTIPWPLNGRIVASFQSRVAPGRPRLSGVQLAPRSQAREVKSIGAGRVRFSDWFGGYGLMLIIDHGDGMMSVYAHNNALFKQVGDWVADQEVVADAGSTGWVEQVRLYFELRDKGKAVNPKLWCGR